MKKLLLLLALGCVLYASAQNPATRREGGKFYTDAFIHEATELYDWHVVENAMAKDLGIPVYRCYEFFNFVFRNGRVSMNEYLALVDQKKIDKNNALQYWTDKLPLFEQIYKDEYVPLTTHNNVSAKQGQGTVQTGGANCNNLDFGNGTTNGWTAQWNNVGNGPGASVYGGLTVGGFNSSLTNRWGYVHEICTGGTDRNVPVNTTPPGHSYALRLGNDSAHQILVSTQNNPLTLPYNHQVVSNTFLVTQQNKAISYWYAVVLCQYNPNNHASNIQPYFQIRMYDGAGNEIQCAHYDVDALTAPTIGGFQTISSSIWDQNQQTSIPYDFFYKDWSQVMIPLANYVGQNVTITFETSDCAGGGHPGYAYVAVDCAPMPNITISPFACGANGSTATLTAPGGAASYSWAGPGIVGSNTGQVVTVNAGGSYTVTMTTLGNSGITCNFSVDTTLAPPPPAVTASFTATSACAGAPIQFTDQSNANGGTITQWNWNFGDGTTSNQNNPTHVYAPGTASPITVNYTVTTAAGCTATIAAPVTILPSPVPSFSTDIVCIGFPTSFTNTTTGAVSYSWTFGDGSPTSSVTNPTHTYPGANSYTAVLTATGANTCTASISHVVLVTPQPTAAGSAPPACLGSPSNFNNSSVYGGTANFSWNFGDPATTNDTSSLKNPSYTYPAAGIYTVSLSLTAGTGCAASTTFTVQVKPIPYVSVTSPSPYCPGSNVPSPVLTSTPSTGVTYNWTNNNTAIGLGASGVGVPPAFTAGQNTSTGMLTGVITIWPTLNGCTGPPATDTISIKIAPIVSQPNVELCPNALSSQINLPTIPANVGATVYWTNITPGTFIGLSQTSGTTSIPAFTAIYPGSTAVGNTIQVYATLNGCTGPTGNFNITVNPYPTALFTHSPACEANQTSFIDESYVNNGVISQWSWDFENDGTIDNTGQNPIHIFPAPGTYTVHLSVTSNKGCPGDTTELVLVNASPHVDFKGDVLAGCSIHTVNFMDSVTMAPPQQIVSYNWYFGNGTSWNGAGPVPSSFSNVSHTNDVYYTISLSVTSDSGCVGTMTKTNYVTVYPIPKAAFSWGPGDADILDPTIQFHDLSIGASGTDAWLWYFGDPDVSNNEDNYATAQDPSHHYSDQHEGIYTVTQWVQNVHGCKDSVSQSVVIHPAFTFYAPNAFTPDGDGLNDGFKGTGIGIDNSTYHIWVFDRWGNIAFESHDLEETWNGRVEDKPAQQDTYTWKVEFRDMTARPHQYKGVVNLIR